MRAERGPGAGSGAPEAVADRVARLLASLHPDGAAALREANTAALDAVDRELFGLCLEHVEATLTGAAPAREPRDARERAFVEFAEQFATSVVSVGDEQVRALREHASDEQVYTFVCALYVTEMTRRVDIVAAEVLA